MCLCDCCRIRVHSQSLTLPWSRWTWTSCPEPGSHRWTCFQPPWSPSQPPLGSRCLVLRRWMKPGYGAAQRKGKGRVDFIGTFFVLRPSLVSGFHPDGLQIIRLCSGRTSSIVSAVVLFVEMLPECVREKPALLSVHSVENMLHERFCREKGIKVWIIYLFNWCCELFPVAKSNLEIYNGIKHLYLTGHFVVVYS